VPSSKNLKTQLLSRMFTVSSILALSTSWLLVPFNILLMVINPFVLFVSSVCFIFVSFMYITDHMIPFNENLRARPSSFSQKKKKTIA
jgi:hypothetical protein